MRPGAVTTAVEGKDEAARAKVTEVARQSATRLGGRLLSMATAVVTLHYASSHYGPVGWGRASTALAYVALLYGLADFGLPALAARDMSTEEADRALIMGDAAGLRALLGMAVVPVAALGALLLYHGQPTILLSVMVLLPSLVTGALGDLSTACLVSASRGDVIALFDIAGGMAGLVAAVTCVRMRLSVPEFLGTTLGAGLVVSALGAFWIRRRLLPGLHVRKDRLLRLAFQAAPLALVGLLNTAYLRLDMVILAALRPAAEVGYYSVAYRIIEPIMFIPAVVMGAALPAYMSAGRTERHKLAQSCITGLTALAVPLVEGGILVSGPLVRSVGGRAFSGSAVPFGLLLIGAGVSYWNGVYGNLLIAEGRQRSLLPLTAGVLGLNLVANLVLIPHWGAPAAAAAASGCVVLAGIWVARLYLRSTGGLPRPRAGAPVWAGAVAMAVVWAILNLALGSLSDPVRITVQIPVMAGAYGVALMIVRGIRPHRLGRTWQA